MRIVLLGPLYELPLQGELLILNSSQLIGLMLATSVVYITNSGTPELFRKAMDELGFVNRADPQGITNQTLSLGDIVVRVANGGRQVAWEASFVR